MCIRSVNGKPSNTIQEGEQDVAADRQELHNINPNRPALTRRQDISDEKENTMDIASLRHGSARALLHDDYFAKKDIESSISYV